MPNPTRQEIIDAYETLDVLLGFSEDRNPDLVPERRHIIEKVLPPRPQPTMAEIEWDDDKHYLAEAEHPTFGKVIMLERSACPGFIRFALAKENEPTWQAAKEKTLTPTGRRYTLTEAQE